MKVFFKVKCKLSGSIKYVKPMFLKLGSSKPQGSAVGVSGSKRGKCIMAGEFYWHS
jgi:hypothetical protein